MDAQGIGWERLRESDMPSSASSKRWLTLDRRRRRGFHIRSVAALRIKSIVGYRDSHGARRRAIASDGRTALTRIRSLQRIRNLAAIRSHEDIDRVAVQIENTSVDVDEVADGLRERADENTGVKRAPIFRHAASASRATAPACAALAACATLSAGAGHAACATLTPSTGRAARSTLTGSTGRAACATLTGSTGRAACATLTASAGDAARATLTASAGRAAHTCSAPASAVASNARHAAHAPDTVTTSRSTAPRHHEGKRQEY